MVATYNDFVNLKTLEMAISLLNGKISTLIGSFCPKYITFDLKKSTEELSFMTLKSDAKFEKKTDLWFGIWDDEYGKFSLEHFHECYLS